jgi:hypothetical protein
MAASKVGSTPRSAGMPARLSGRAIEKKYGAGRRAIVKALASAWSGSRKQLSRSSQRIWSVSRRGSVLEFCAQPLSRSAADAEKADGRHRDASHAPSSHAIDVIRHPPGVRTNCVAIRPRAANAVPPRTSRFSYVLNRCATLPNDSVTAPVLTPLLRRVVAGVE